MVMIDGPDSPGFDSRIRKSLVFFCWFFFDFDFTIYLAFRRLRLDYIAHEKLIPFPLAGFEYH